MKKSTFKRLGVSVVFLMMLGLMPVSAQQQFQGVCSRVKMVILQELTLERIGFEATLELTNNDGDDPITDFSAELTFENPLLTTNEIPNDSSQLFFVRAPTFENVDSVSGTGSIGPTKKAIVRWFIIPKISAGGVSPDGVKYRVGANLSGKIRGNTIPAEVMKVFPATIPVKPEPQLEITYFQPRDVQGDDPFTPEVESPIPFTVGVLVKNSGFGLAKKMKIASQQPRIIENKQNLLLIAQLLGSRVNDSSLANGNLTVDLGNLNPGQTIKGAWDMITSLSGEFVEFKASYTHASELGGEETSVIKSLNAYFIAHEVQNDQPGRDSIKDFLADTDDDLIPDALYESEGNTLPVNYLVDAQIAGGGYQYTVTLNADKGSWGYFRVSDPAQARLPISRVVRSDGKVLNANNVWTNIRYEKGSNQRLTWLNFVDLVNVGTYTYTVTYAPVAQDTTDPVTTLHFAGPVTPSGGKHYITPETQMYFISDDASPVSIYYSVGTNAFLPALPFRLQNPGEYPVRFYATDSFNNTEQTNRATLVVSGVSSLDFASINGPTDPIAIPGDASSIRPGTADINFAASVNPTAVNAQVDVFQGVVGWATVAGVPSSPTRARGASLTVAGENVDYYKYRLNGSAWSSEQPVASPILLLGLNNGNVRVDVLGRSQHGGYLPDSAAVSVFWVVDPNAASTMVSGTPATPSRQTSATLNVGGADVTSYRYTINGGFYRPESNVVNAIQLTALTSTQTVVSVIGKTNGVYQPTNIASTVTWKYDPMYGSDFTALSKVRSAIFTNIGSAVATFTWNGRNDSNVIVTPGWYTVRVILSDTLGRQVFGTKLIRLDEVSGAVNEIADATRGAKNAHARRGRVVWQDQSSGGFNIYVRNLTGTNASIASVSSGSLSQENPKTDGRYVVWQARQPNGNWDVYLKDIDSGAAAVPVTSVSTRDEINPAVEWPWVVYQSKMSGDPAAISQIAAKNMITGDTFAVAPGPQDQVDPDIQGGRVVWQDFRDVGPGEIYYRNLESAEVRRITTNSWGQYHPAIFDNVIVWQDNRAGQVDLVAFDLLRNAELQLTSTPENETRPFMDGDWVVAEEDSLGANIQNIRLVHIPSRKVVPLTRSMTFKSRPSLSGGAIVWQEQAGNISRIITSEMPSLQAVFENRNVIAVTAAMAEYQGDAYTLLNLWKDYGAEEITRYTAFVPQVTSQTVQLVNGVPSGPNFPLVAGQSLWVKFAGAQVLDLGVNAPVALSLSPGVNVFSYTHFPSDYSAYQLLRYLGLNNIRALRMLDSEAGNWVVAEVKNGAVVGQDFHIPQVAVLMLDLVNGVAQFKPE